VPDAASAPHWSRHPLDPRLLDGKLRVPVAAEGAVSRAGVIGRVLSSGSRVVSVTAPAGYGKSMLLAEWAAQERRHVGWIRLDTFDNDPSALLAALTAASAEFVDGAAKLAAMLGNGGAESLGRGAPLLAMALQDAPEPFALFIDDAHTVSAPDCEDVLDVVMGAIPDGSVIVLASRHTLPYIARQRVEGRVSEIGVSDLRLGVEAARRIADEVGAGASETDLAEWVRRCDGWPTGLFLCALIARDGRPIATGDDRRISDYLYRECLTGLPIELREFLVHSSVLGDLSADACNAVLRIANSAALLREAEHRNLFVIPVEGERGRFRYHDLFREFLQAELDASFPGAGAGLHARAAHWYESRGLPRQAIDHWFRSGDLVRAAELVAEVVLALHQRGEVVLVRRWMDALGDRVLEQVPRAAANAVWLALLQGSEPDVARRLGVLDRAILNASGDRDAAPQSHRAMIRAAMFTGPISEGLVDAEFASRAESLSSPWRAMAAYIRGLMLTLSGDAERARLELERAATLGRELGHAGAVLLSEADLAGLDIEAGDYRSANAHAASARALVALRNMDGYVTAITAEAVSARIAVRRGDVDAARSALARAMRSRIGVGHLLPSVAVQARLHMAVAWLDLGEWNAARAMLAEIDEVLAHRPHIGALLTRVEEVRALLRVMSAEAGSMTPLTPAELRLLPYLQTHLTLGDIAKRLVVSRNTVNSQTAAIYRKLAVSNRAGAVAEAKHRGLLGA
jgi:LuxR family maltose regulon positive regulatory protein